MLARIIDGEIDAFIDLTMDDVPLHKRHYHLPVVDEGDGPTLEILIEADRVRRVRTQLPLAQVKSTHLLRVDDDAERIRQKYITRGDGMAITYREKLEQAEQAIAQGQAAIDALTTEEQIAAYPTLAASVGIEGATLWDCAQIVLVKYQQWAGLSHAIEKIRLAGKKAINDAETVEAVQAAYDAVDWGDL
tara:strand:- start:316 stop:885 length:570 start_codon:yes stop_codon:yes gene_type:complete